MAQEKVQKAIFVTTITVNDPQTGGSVELEIWKDLFSNALFGLESTYLDQVTEDVRSPYNNDIHLTLDEDSIKDEQPPQKTFAKTELITIFEAAHIALADADTFDDIAEQMDITDAELSELREKLHKYLNA